jgi:hypothetical protein
MVVSPSTFPLVDRPTQSYNPHILYKKLVGQLTFRLIIIFLCAQLVRPTRRRSFEAPVTGCGVNGNWRK